MMDEQREQQRYCFVHEICLETSRGVDFFSESTNLSLGGIFIESEFPLPMGTKGCMAIKIKEVCGLNERCKEIDVEFDVVHVVTKESSMTAIPGMGIRFLNLSPEDAADLEELIENLEPEK